MKSVTRPLCTDDPISGAAQRASRAKRVRRHPLLAMSIGKRLALGFLIPILIVFVGLANIGIQIDQLLTNVTTFNQHLLHAYTTLTADSITLQQVQTGMLGALNDAEKKQVSASTLREDRLAVGRLVASYQTNLNSYLQQDVLVHSPRLSSLFNAAGHDDQMNEQQVYSDAALQTWQAYQDAITQVFDAISSGDINKAQILESERVELSYASSMTSLLMLIQFTSSLVPSIHDATLIEESQLQTVMVLSLLSLLAGMAIVTWLVSSTLVQRLQRFRTVVQSVEQGQFSARVAVEGRDEIALVSRAVNTTLDTVVGLLEETRHQRDELTKGKELERLHEALQHEHEALNEANSRLSLLATTDMLTNLPNHRALQSLLEQECERARRFGRPLSLLFFDGDRFKTVNDTYGHAVGDVVLRELGERTRSVLRAGDTIGRFGGEEFLVLLPETDEAEAKCVAERLRGAVAAFPLATQEVEGGIAVTVSIGVASFPDDGVIAGEVREQADQAMYWAKRLGRNQVRTAAEAARANRDAALRAATAHALERKELNSLDTREPEQQLRIEQLRLIYSLMGALDWREPGTSTHAHEVSDLVVSMARLLQFDEVRIMRASTAAFLHDIGKIALPDRLLQQPRQQFSTQEWRLLHQHAELGAAIVEDSPWLSDLAPAIRYHHERWDGTGTPDELSGEAIPLEARLIAIAEAYHAMMSDRPYQKARSTAEALEELERRSGTQFDPSLLPIFRAVLEERENGVNNTFVQSVHVGA